MEKELTLDNQMLIGKVYKEKEIYVGTFLGGPLVAGYMIAENFKIFGEPVKAKQTWIFAIIGTIVIFSGIFLIPDSVKIPNQIIPLIYIGIAYYFVKHFQEQKITAHIHAGGQFYSWWRTIGVSLIVLLITLIPIFAIVYASYTATSATATTKSYGIKKNEIDFDKTNITESEVDKIADGLTKTAFFNDETTIYIFTKKIGNNYELSISCNKTVTGNPEALTEFIQLRREMQTLFPNNKIILNLVVDNLDNVVKRIE